MAVPDALLVIFHQEKVASWKISPIFKEGHNSMDSDDIFQTLQHDVDIQAIQFFVVFFNLLVVVFFIAAMLPCNFDYSG